MVSMKPQRTIISEYKKEAQHIERLYADFLKEIAALRGKQKKIIEKYTRALEKRKLAHVRKQLGLR